MSGKDSKDEKYPYQFCALEYRPQGWGRGATSSAPVILLVLKDEKGGLRLMVSPDLNTIVEGDDQNWLDPLLVDLQDRAGMQPADLFKQLSSLGVGPLVAQEVGEEIGKYPRLRDLQKQFIDLDIKPRRKTD